MVFFRTFFLWSQVDSAIYGREKSTRSLRRLSFGRDFNQKLDRSWEGKRVVFPVGFGGCEVLAGLGGGGPICLFFFCLLVLAP